MSDQAPASCLVLQAFELRDRRVRAVVEFADKRIALCEGKPASELRGVSPAEAFAAGPGKALHDPISLPQAIRFAERCLVGDQAAITHPKAIMVLATLCVAFVASLSMETTPDGPRQTD